MQCAELANLARTCRIFSDIVLNALWKSLDSLGPLIDCLPNNLVERVVDGDVQLVGRCATCITLD